MAKSKPTTAETTVAPAQATGGVGDNTTKPQPESLEQTICNRLGVGLVIAKQWLEAADRETVAAQIDALTNDELAALLNPSNKA